MKVLLTITHLLFSPVLPTATVLIYKLNPLFGIVAQKLKLLWVICVSKCLLLGIVALGQHQVK
jgi:hypothetical protein